MKYKMTIEKGGTSTVVMVESPDAESAFYAADARDLIVPGCLVSVEPAIPGEVNPLDLIDDDE